MNKTFLPFKLILEYKQFENNAELELTFYRKF